MNSYKYPDAEAAIELAAELLKSAAEMQTSAERRQQAELDRMIGHDADKATLVEMTDQAFRTHTPARVADQLTHLLDVQGIPRFFSPVEQAMLRGFQAFGEYLPGVAVPMVKEKMRQETANVILPAERELLAEHLQKRQAQGVQMNVNLLGEAILGEAEASRRMQQILDLLRVPDVGCVSVKISTVYSQVSPLAQEHTVSVVSDRLEILYRTALQEKTKDNHSKFVYLDMEEYRDLHLTADALIDTLDRDGLQDVCAGIALQAYIPDSYSVMKRLIAWSSQRVSGGGGPLTIRLVKGANMEMERVDASIEGHEQAPYKTKLETDANYKCMLRELIDAAADSEVRLGVASHNLFDVALAMIWTNKANASPNVQFEMLEGMANHQRRAISARDADMLLYAPACRKSDFLNAIGYLIRRLDENTGKQNFLRHAYRLKPGSDDFKRLAGDFARSLENMLTVTHAPRKSNDRCKTPSQPAAAVHWSEFQGEPDTDWSKPENTEWAKSIIECWKSRCDESAMTVPLVIGDENTNGTNAESLDPSRPDKIICRYQKANEDSARKAVSIASQAFTSWSKTTTNHRHDLLRGVAQNLRERRADLIGAMIADGGKTISEADPEVSEAIDFCEFYPLTVLDWISRKSFRCIPRGVVAVISPWNFPLAIPCGGVASALSAGNTVILKPSGQTVLTAYMLCQAFWDAGIPRDVLQLVPCDGRIAEPAIVKNPEVDTVILTGSTQTAKRMLAARPDLHLLAETGGKNATIVTAMADRDLAIKHVIHSAFGHSGQKCSATSLLLLENEVFDDPKFREMLADAVKSLHVGSAWQRHTKMGPLISPPGDDLTRGMKTLKDDESWLVMPEHVVGNPNLYRPGVKWNVAPGSFSHTTELFGPVLSVMRFSRLEEAIEIVRSTGYGLTSGLESLDDREIKLWRQSIGAGNLYINRPTTGAIVLRQPFGGVGLSAYGPGVKAGGPHYVLPLMRINDSDSDATQKNSAAKSDSKLLPWALATIQQCGDGSVSEQQVRSAIASQLAASETEFRRWHDHFELVGQDNLRGYRPMRGLTIRFERQDSVRDAVFALSASVAVGTQTTLSISPDVDETVQEALESAADREPGLVHPIDESEQELVNRIAEDHVQRLRLLHAADPVSPIVSCCGEKMITIVSEPVLSDGRIECLRYLNEQSISYNYHRYGNLGRRA